MKLSNNRYKEMVKSSSGSKWNAWVLAYKESPAIKIESIKSQYRGEKAILINKIEYTILEAAKVQAKSFDLTTSDKFRRWLLNSIKGIEKESLIQLAVGSKYICVSAGVNDELCHRLRMKPIMKDGSKFFVTDVDSLKQINESYFKKFSNNALKKIDNEKVLKPDEVKRIFKPLESTKANSIAKELHSKINNKPIKAGELKSMVKELTPKPTGKVGKPADYDGYAVLHGQQRVYLYKVTPAMLAKAKRTAPIEDMFDKFKSFLESKPHSVHPWEKGTVGYIRYFDDYVHDGERAVFIQEIQSDLRNKAFHYWNNKLENEQIKIPGGENYIKYRSAKTYVNDNNESLQYLNNLLSSLETEDDSIAAEILNEKQSVACYMFADGTTDVNHLYIHPKENKAEKIDGIKKTISYITNKTKEIKDVMAAEPLNNEIKIFWKWYDSLTEDWYIHALEHLAKQAKKNGIKKIAITKDSFAGGSDPRESAPAQYKKYYVGTAGTLGLEWNKTNEKERWDKRREELKIEREKWIKKRDEESAAAEAAHNANIEKAKEELDKWYEERDEREEPLKEAWEKKREEIRRDREVWEDENTPMDFEYWIEDFDPTDHDYESHGDDLYFKQEDYDDWEDTQRKDALRRLRRDLFDEFKNGDEYGYRDWIKEHHGESEVNNPIYINENEYISWLERTHYSVYEEKLEEYVEEEMENNPFDDYRSLASIGGDFYDDYRNNFESDPPSELEDPGEFEEEQPPEEMVMAARPYKKPDVPEELEDPGEYNPSSGLSYWYGDTDKFISKLETLHESTNFYEQAMSAIKDADKKISPKELKTILKSVSDSRLKKKLFDRTGNQTILKSDLKDEIYKIGYKGNELSEPEPYTFGLSHIESLPQRSVVYKFSDKALKDMMEEAKPEWQEWLSEFAGIDFNLLHPRSKNYIGHIRYHLDYPYNGKKAIWIQEIQSDLKNDAYKSYKGDDKKEFLDWIDSHTKDWHIYALEGLLKKAKQEGFSYFIITKEFAELSAPSEESFTKFYKSLAKKLDMENGSAEPTLINPEVSKDIDKLMKKRQKFEDERESALAKRKEKLGAYSKEDVYKWALTDDAYKAEFKEYYDKEFNVEVDFPELGIHGYTVKDHEEALKQLAVNSFLSTLYKFLKKNLAMKIYFGIDTEYDLHSLRSGWDVFLNKKAGNLKYGIGDSFDSSMRRFVEEYDPHWDRHFHQLASGSKYSWHDEPIVPSDQEMMAWLKNMKSYKELQSDFEKSIKDLTRIPEYWQEDNEKWLPRAKFWVKKLDSEVIKKLGLLHEEKITSWQLMIPIYS